MKDGLVTLARSLGFAQCRVAKCNSPPHAGAFLSWLGHGHAGEMAWLERNKDRRTDPQLVLPGACSVIMLAMNYWQGKRESHAKEGNAQLPRIAGYALGEDYHGLIEKKLRELDDYLREHGGIQKCYVDTGPILERDYAAAAGAGWQGKSTMLVHPELGVWFFLASILTTLEIEPDQPLPDRCGRCTRCIDACPTGAIISPHQLDARRCISYLTIELKGSIPLEYRALIGDRIYGCDDCLEACPWNRFAQVSAESSFASSHATNGMTLSDYLKLSGDEFRTLFRNSPIKRIKRRGFLRNVCVAIGNTGGPENLEELRKAAEDPEPLIAEHARWAIDQILSRHPSPS